MRALPDRTVCAYLTQALAVLKTRGFVNYFGMQRFGTQSVPTHAVGLAMLAGDLAAAVDLILMPRKNLDEKATRDQAYRQVCSRFFGVCENAVVAQPFIQFNRLLRTHARLQWPTKPPPTKLS